jgi:hypothetical protein
MTFWKLRPLFFPKIFYVCENDLDFVSVLLILEVAVAVGYCCGCRLLLWLYVTAVAVGYLSVGHLFCKLHSLKPIYFQIRKNEAKDMTRKLLSTFCDTIARFSGRLLVSVVNVT